MFSADGEDLDIEIVDPRVYTIEPNPVTADAAGLVSFEITGAHFHDELELGLVASTTNDTRVVIERTLEGSLEDGFQTRVTPGTYQLAWQPIGKPAELAPEAILEVLPPPTVTSVSPESVEPNRPVDLLLRVLNLAAVDKFTLTPLTSRGEPLELALDTERLRALEELEFEYLTDEIVLETGTYAIGPGEQVTLEVIEDCKVLLDAYREDPSGLDELVRCLSKGHSSDEIRLEGADLLFDQGHFDPAFESYEKLDHQKARFRRALIARTLEDNGGYPFDLLASDEPQSPYARAAAALGWISAGDIDAPSDPNGTWELDYVRGTLAKDANVGIEALELSIATKSTAAGGHEHQQYDPAFNALALARLNLGVKLLRDAKPIDASRHVGATFFDGASDDYSRPSSDDRACFVHGHVQIWQDGNDESATEILTRGMSEEGEHAALCMAYLQSIGRKSEGGARASKRSGSLGSWEWNFVEATAHYRKVRDEPNYNIFTEKSDRGSAIYPKEREASAALHRALRALEDSPRSLDPVAQGALFYYLRNAQRQAWPEQH